MARMMDDDFAWVPGAFAARDWALAIGGQLRAYDGESLRLSPTHCGPVSGPADWYCAHTRAYVVPRRRASHATGGPGRNNSLARRGLVHHRVLPGKIGSDVVDIVIVGDLSPPGAASSPRRVGGATFSAVALALDLTQDGSAGRFRAVDLEGRGTEETVLRHVGKAFEQGCFAVSLVTCLGYIEDKQPTLVPFVDVKLFADGEDMRRVALSEMITLDNMTDLLSDLSTDMRSACRELNVLARGAVTVEPARLQSMRTALSQVIEQIQGCLEDLDGIAIEGPLGPEVD